MFSSPGFLPVPRSCTESEYRCDNLRCIPTRWVCDHDNDCEDNSDERDCGKWSLFVLARELAVGNDGPHETKKQ